MGMAEFGWCGGARWESAACRTLLVSTRMLGAGVCRRRRQAGGGKQCMRGGYRPTYAWSEGGAGGGGGGRVVPGGVWGLGRVVTMEEAAACLLGLVE